MFVLTWESFTAECSICNRNNEIMLLLKALQKNMHHKEGTILHYLHCVPLIIFNMLTQSFPVVKVTAENVKR